MSYINNNLLTQAHMDSAYGSVYEEEVIKRYKNIRENSEYSNKNLGRLRDKLNEKFNGLNIADTSIIIFGSYARLDASRESDLDHLIVPKGALSEASAIQVLEEVMNELAIHKPNPDGVFSGAIDEEKITKSIGSKDDSYNDMSRRLLFLLESRPILGADLHARIVDRLVEEYARDVAKDPRKNYVYLLNDLIRYFRTICVNYAYTKQEDSQKWPLRNIKLRHSRVIMYASLIAMLGVLSTYRDYDKNDRLREFIKLTPLQRLHRAYLEVGDTGFYKVAGNYDVFLGFMNDKEVRASLKGLNYQDRYESREFAILKANSDALAAEISRFIFDRRGVWSDRFYEYLLL